MRGLIEMSHDDHMISKCFCASKSSDRLLSSSTNIHGLACKEKVNYKQIIRDKYCSCVV